MEVLVAVLVSFSDHVTPPRAAEETPAEGQLRSEGSGTVVKDCQDWRAWSVQERQLRKSQSGAKQQAEVHPPWLPPSASAFGFLPGIPSGTMDVS